MRRYAKVVATWVAFGFLLLCLVGALELVNDLMAKDTREYAHMVMCAIPLLASLLSATQDEDDEAGCDELNGATLALSRDPQTLELGSPTIRPIVPRARSPPHNDILVEVVR